MIKKEIETLRAVWAWAKEQGYAACAAPAGKILYPKSKEKPPFQTWAQIEAIVQRGGLTQDEEKEL
jgi:hypothetical protein